MSGKGKGGRGDKNGDKNGTSASSKAGLQVPVGRVGPEGKLKLGVSGSADLASVLEFLVANDTRPARKRHILPRYISWAIRKNKFSYNWPDEVTTASGGVSPNNHAVSLPKTTEKAETKGQERRDTLGRDQGPAQQERTGGPSKQTNKQTQNPSIPPQPTQQSDPI
jgi:histone H2A